MKYHRYQLKGKRGINDLYCEYAFVSGYQGGTENTNSIERFKESKGWLVYMFKCEMTDAAIKTESERRIRLNQEYIQRLKTEGRFGEEYITTLELIDDPELDNLPTIQSNPLETYKFIILDAGTI